MKTTFLSYGGGIQTFSLLVMIQHGIIPIVDEIIFADTGLEKRETYDHIETVVRPICQSLEIPFTVVRMKKVVDDL